MGSSTLVLLLSQNPAKASRGWAHLEEKTWGTIHTICLLFSERCTSLTRISWKPPCVWFSFLFLVYEWKSKFHEWFLYPYDTECVCEWQVIWGFMCKVGAFQRKAFWECPWLILRMPQPLGFTYCMGLLEIFLVYVEDALNCRMGSYRDSLQDNLVEDFLQDNFNSKFYLFLLKAGGYHKPKHTFDHEA
jgi:hypothetical protein